MFVVVYLPLIIVISTWWCGGLGAWISISQLPTSQNNKDQTQVSSEIVLPICHESVTKSTFKVVYEHIVKIFLLLSNYSVECLWRK